MTKYKGQFKPGQIVHVRSKWGQEAGKVREDRFYRIDKIGPKQCTLMEVDPADHSKQIGWRARNHWLDSGETYTQWLREREAGSMQSYRCREWGQYLAGAGNEGWDPEANFS